MPYDPRDLPPAVLQFVTDRHLATLTTLRADGTPHVVPVGFTWDGDAGLARVITSGGSVKARNAGRPGARAAVCQVEGRAWLTLEGPVEVRSDPDDVADAVQRYARRYRTPRENPQRVALLIRVDRVLGSVRDEG